MDIEINQKNYMMPKLGTFGNIVHFTSLNIHKSSSPGDRNKTDNYIVNNINFNKIPRGNPTKTPDLMHPILVHKGISK